LSFDFAQSFVHGPVVEAQTDPRWGEGVFDEHAFLDPLHQQNGAPLGLESDFVSASRSAGKAALPSLSSASGRALALRIGPAAEFSHPIRCGLLGDSAGGKIRGPSGSKCVS